MNPFSLDRMVRAVELVHQRLLRATAALEGAGLPYAVAGGNAVALWVSRVDPGAVRNTSDVDLLVRRADLDAIKAAMAAAGFEYRDSVGLDLFLDGPEGRARDGVRLIFAGETVRPGEPLPNPDVTESEPGGEFRVLGAAAPGGDQADGLPRQGPDAPARHAGSRPDRRQLGTILPRRTGGPPARPGRDAGGIAGPPG
jgi:hypothetical protein